MKRETSLKSTIGTGTATVELTDVKQADLIFIFGANPASNHPRLLKELIKCRRRGGHVIIVNPIKEPGLIRFALPNDLRSMMAGGSPIASEYIQPHIGGGYSIHPGSLQGCIGGGRRRTTNYNCSYEPFRFVQEGSPDSFLA